MILAHFRAIARTIERGADGGAVPPGEDLAENSHALRLAFYRDVLQWGMVAGGCAHTPSSNFSRLIFSCQTKGARWWTLCPSESTATVTGMSCTSNRSEEHTSELKSLMRISYAVFCLKKKQHNHHEITMYT